MTEFDHNQLLHAFRSGDPSAFESVFKLYYKPLRLQAFLILGNEPDAEDQVQQLFLDMWNRQLYRNVHDAPGAYLHAAVRNRCFNCLKKASHTHKVMEDYAGTLLHAQPEEAAEPVLQTFFQAALNELPAQRFTAFQLVHMEDKKYHEAAQQMGISVNSLKSHLKLAVKFLKLRLKK